MTTIFTVAVNKIVPSRKVRKMITVTGTGIKIPVTVIRGRENGPVVLTTSGIHGGEYPGIAAAMELGCELTPKLIHGCLILIHPVNITAFWDRAAEITPEDGRNLNRVFPGNHEGSLSEKIAHFLMEEFIRKADFYLDLHSGDILEDLHPYVYFPGNTAPEITAKAREVAHALDVEYMVRSTATTGAYNYAALNGIPSLLVERGGNGYANRADIDAYKDDVIHVLKKLGVLAPTTLHAHAHKFVPREITNIIYLQSDHNTCWFHTCNSGDRIRQGDRLGYTTDLFGRPERDYVADFDGVILYITPALAVKPGTILLAYGELKD